jgi:hypothetical protein
MSWAADRRVRVGAGLVALAYLLVRLALMLSSNDPILGADARTYWGAPLDNPYPGPQLGLPGAYLYPPPFIQALSPLRLLPFEVFQAVWALIGAAALVFLVGPVGAALAITFLPFVFRDLLVGNIHLMLAAAIVIGLRQPPALAFPILTKITPSVGILWFVARREWRKAVIAVGVATIIAAVSFALAPNLWFEWLARMRGDTGTAGDTYLLVLVARVAGAAVLVFIAGLIGRAWLIPIAVLVSLPILWPDSLALLLACFPLIAAEMRERMARRADVQHAATISDVTSATDP